jgi:hypothetical protein
MGASRMKYDDYIEIMRGACDIHRESLEMEEEMDEIERNARTAQSASRLGVDKQTLKSWIDDEEPPF